jgi:hypothetical protein
VCGGESVRSHDLSRLRGRRVIAINSSFLDVPWADFLVFSDRRWWDLHGPSVLDVFRGRVVALTPMHPSRHYLPMERVRASGICDHRDSLALWHTTTCPASNLAAHLGVTRINYLGLDGRGGWHHSPHKWRQHPRKFDYHESALRLLTRDLTRRGIQFRGACPDSRYDDFVPHCPFEEMVS